MNYTANYMTRVSEHKNLVGQKAQIIADRIGKPICVKVIATATYAKRKIRLMLKSPD